MKLTFRMLLPPAIQFLLINSKIKLGFIKQHKSPKQSNENVEIRSFNRTFFLNFSTSDQKRTNNEKRVTM